MPHKGGGTRKLSPTDQSGHRDTTRKTQGIPVAPKQVDSFPIKFNNRGQEPTTEKSSD